MSKLDPQNLIAQFSEGTPDICIAERLGVSQRTVLRWRHGQGSLTIWRADALAKKLQEHPSTIWPGWYQLTDRGAA